MEEECKHVATILSQGILCQVSKEALLMITTIVFEGVNLDRCSSTFCRLNFVDSRDHAIMCTHKHPYFASLILQLYNQPRKMDSLNGNVKPPFPM